MAASLASVPELLKKLLTPPSIGTIAADLLGEPHLRLVVEVGPRHVQELLRLLDDGGDDLGMRVRRSS